MKSALISILCLLAWGCDSGGDPGEDGADARVGGAGGGGGGGLACGALLDDCPIGTTPSVEESLIAQCNGQAGVQLEDGAGAITGVCEQTAACLLVCTFNDPCTCGVDRITREGVFCVDCTGAAGCGDGICEGGESPVDCPADCGPQCDPGGEGRPAEQRCDGEVRQVCEANARWADLDCRPDQICEPYTGGANRLTFCQTRTNPIGGQFRGLGARGFDVQGNPTDIRFRTPDLTCPAQRIGVLRTIAEDDGSLLFLDGDPIVRMHMPERTCELLPLHGLGSVIDFAGGRGVAGTQRALTVWEPDTGRAYQTMPFVDDYVQAPLTFVAFAPGGALVGAAMTVDGHPMVAVWDAATGAVQRLLRIDDAEVAAVVGEGAREIRFSANGKHLFEVRGSKVVVWDLETGRYVEVLDFGVPVLRVALDPTGRPRMAVLLLGSVVMRDLEAGRTLWQYPLMNQGLVIDYSPDGAVVGVGTWQASDGVIHVPLLDANDGHLVRDLPAGLYDRGWLQMLFVPDGHHLVVNVQVFSDIFMP